MLCQCPHQSVFALYFESLYNSSATQSDSLFGFPSGNNSGCPTEVAPSQEISPLAVRLMGDVFINFQVLTSSATSGSPQHKTVPSLNITALVEKPQ